jgi:hypothetical protein
MKGFTTSDATNWLKFFILLIILIIVIAFAVWLLGILGSFNAFRQWLIHALGG